MNPTKVKHYPNGSKLGNKVMTQITQIRVGRSELNSHRFTIGLSENPEYICHTKQESSLHFILDFFVYTAKHQILFYLIEHYVPRFFRMKKMQSTIVNFWELKVQPKL